jgi:uncharacterized membrane protein YuzA (DUF378 family)
MKILNAIALTLVIVGALNWGLVALLDLDLVAATFGAGSALATAVYGLVGLAGLWAITFYGRLGGAAAPARDRMTTTPATRPAEARNPAERPQRSAPARAAETRPAQTDATATPVAAAGQDGPADPAAAGTTHDPNSVTTGTSVEPTRDVYPPKGERAASARLN